MMAAHGHQEPQQIFYDYGAVPDPTDFIPFAEGGKLRVGIISRNFGDRAVSTGITMEFTVSGCAYDGFPVRINPVNRDEAAPLMTLTMLLNPQAGKSGILNSLSGGWNPV